MSARYSKSPHGPRAASLLSSTIPAAWASEKVTGRQLSLSSGSRQQPSAAPAPAPLRASARCRIIDIMSLSPVLIVFGGLPGTGKTTIARELTVRLSATYLRIDSIEQALRDAGFAAGAEGYAIANALAAENLKLGRIVIADCVNPVLASRAAWRRCAVKTSARLVEIETVCSEPALHRQRVESRTPDIEGFRLPPWSDVVNRAYEPWDRERLVLDTADGSLDDLLERAETYIRDRISRLAGPSS
ncbi:AAA family ATPase [Bradyrhizobium sp. 62B]|uniref:AAA family ATPase n=1 Tax=Bradyrhizobium sp. 62B TaxID=2898442 RepID=UPI002557D4BA|nr:AAA family ATPase [Bradyrhizobium sp. 62B]